LESALTSNGSHTPALTVSFKVNPFNAPPPATEEYEKKLEGEFPVSNSNNGSYSVFGSVTPSGEKGLSLRLATLSHITEKNWRGDVAVRLTILSHVAPSKCTAGA
jgi:glycogen synthase